MVSWPRWAALCGDCCEIFCRAGLLSRYRQSECYAAIDAAIDAASDAAIDAAIEAAIDAAIEAAIDAAIEAAIDAAIEAANDCRRAGLFIPLRAVCSEWCGE